MHATSLPSGKDIASAKLEQIDVYFPRGEQIKTIEILVEDGATVVAPTPCKHKKPVVFTVLPSRRAEAYNEQMKLRREAGRII